MWTSTFCFMLFGLRGGAAGQLYATKRMDMCAMRAPLATGLCVLSKLSHRSFVGWDLSTRNSTNCDPSGRRLRRDVGVARRRAQEAGVGFLRLNFAFRSRKTNPRTWRAIFVPHRRDP